MSSATLEKLLGLFDRREQRTLPPIIRGDTRAERMELRENLRIALESLESSGMFEQRDSTGKTLVDSLLRLTEETLWDPFAREPGRTRIFFELVFNVFDPKRINQGLKGTCAAACIEGYLAERDPAEYSRIVAGLVTREGLVTMKSGQMLVCNEDVLAPHEREQRRNAVSRIFQAACMEFAYPNMPYDNVVDGHFHGDDNVGSGLEINAFERLLQAITGQTWKTITVMHSRLAKQFASFGVETRDVVDIGRDGVAIIDQAARQNEQVFVTLELPSMPNPIPHAEPPVLYNMPHKVRALRVDWTNRVVHYDDPMDPDRRWFDGAEMTLHDSFGHCSMPIDDFSRLMTEMSYRPEFFTREADQQAPAQPRTE